jgi:hypothetical protein
VKKQTGLKSIAVVSSEHMLDILEGSGKTLQSDISENSISKTKISD